MKIDARKRFIDTAEGKLISPNSLEEMAIETDPKPRFICASSYWNTICILRDQKEFMWREIEEWFNEHGLDFSMQSIISAYRKGKQ